jgi:hypothetical protein
MYFSTCNIINKWIMFVAFVLLLWISVSDSKVLNSNLKYLHPSNIPECVSDCVSYHGSADGPLVCMYQGSGVGTLKQNIDLGGQCFPPYNCREDWNVCVKKHQTPPDMSSTAACGEILGLIAGGYNGGQPPPQGWKPTSHGWRKGSGNIGCGYGSTYNNVHPSKTLTMADFGRVELQGFVGDIVDCCKEAMKYDGVDIAHGGAAVRFDLYGTTCRIDRELMMRGNLDTSSGRPLDKIDACGATNDYLYWRPAAGAADAADLQNAGRCAHQYNFTKVTGTNTIKPKGRLPDGIELPNHDCAQDPSQCMQAVRYNSINTAEECCAACAEARWLPQGTPCVAFQIVDGKCRILRQKWFDTRYGPNRITTSSGMTITDTIAACAGFEDHNKCSRNDNSHGYWGTCQQDCNLYSHMYFRDPRGQPLPPPTNNTNVTFRKIQVLDTAALNITANVSIVTDRTTKRKKLTKAPPPPTGMDTDADSLGGYVHGNPGKEICAQISIYIRRPGLLFYDISISRDVFDPGRIHYAIFKSNQCCQNKNNRQVKECQLNIDVSKEFLDSKRGRRLDGGSVEQLVIVYECIGPGKDLCDLDVLQNQPFVNTVVDVATPAPSSTYTKNNPISPSPSSTAVPTHSIVPSGSNTDITLSPSISEVSSGSRLSGARLGPCLYMFIISWSHFRP